MDNARNDELISKSTISFKGPQEQTMTMVPLNDLYRDRFRLLEENNRSSMNEIEQATDAPVDQAPLFDPKIDPKKLKGIIANRENQKKFRDKQAYHEFDMKKKANELEVNNWGKRQEIMSYEQKNAMLKEEHEILFEKAVALEWEHVAKELEWEELRQEKQRLEQLVMMQQLNGETSTNYLSFGDPAFPNNYGPQF